MVWFGLVLIWFIFMAISTLVGLLKPNPLYTYKQFYFKQFSFNCQNSSISSYLAYSTKLNGFKYGYISRMIQLNISQFIYTQLDVKQSIQSSISTVFCLHIVICKRKSSISSNSVQLKYTV